MTYQIHKYEMKGENVDLTVMFSILVGNVFTSFLFGIISYVMFYQQTHLFIKIQNSVRQTAQMQDVLQEIDDGVIILEEKEDKEESFINVEFANSFMKQLFGSKFNSDSPESAKRI